MDAKTIVVFRRYKDGQIIALMPELPWDQRNHCTSYMNIGQHGGAAYYGVIAQTKPAQPAEYAPLLRELESIGYHVVVRARKPNTRKY